MELEEFKIKLENIREEYAQKRLDIETVGNYDKESWTERLNKIQLNKLRKW